MIASGSQRAEDSQENRQEWYSVPQEDGYAGRRSVIVAQ